MPNVDPEFISKYRAEGKAKQREQRWKMIQEIAEIIVPAGCVFGCSILSYLLMAAVILYMAKLILF